MATEPTPDAVTITGVAVVSTYTFSSMEPEVLELNVAVLSDHDLTATVSVRENGGPDPLTAMAKEVGERVAEQFAAQLQRRRWIGPGMI